MNYSDFLEAKTHAGALAGFTPLWMPSELFDVQAFIVEWAIRNGRSAILADCGFGKSFMELVWAQNVVMHTNKPVLIMAPLAVAMQTVGEAAKFGIEANRSSDGKVKGKITVANYERLHLFDPNDYGGVVCDEASILKSFDGAIRQAITNFMRKVPYRLLGTATAAPNDYIELGTCSEALGYLGYMDMLNRFFRNDNNNSATKRMYGEAPKWRFKGHAKTPFWRWVASWALAVRRPSDLGFEDGKFILPPMYTAEHKVDAKTNANGMLFNLPAHTLPEQREEKRRTIQERGEKMAVLIAARGNKSFAVCHLNDEAALLKKIIPGSIEVSGADPDEAKEEKFLAFIKGEGTLVTKSKIGAWGLNFQHCNHIARFPSHSYEQAYQIVRRCWRFGQKRPVYQDIILTEGERQIMKNEQRKSDQADAMFESLVSEMKNAQGIKRVKDATIPTGVPSWL